MTPASWIVLGIILILAGIAVVMIAKGKTGGCSSCTGNCAECGKKRKETTPRGKKREK